MKYWKEKSTLEDIKFWSGNLINKLEKDEIFVFGSNPSGIHGAGAAKVAVGFGARYGVGRGLSGSTYALVTKNLDGKEGSVERSTGIVYEKGGFGSVSPTQIRENIKEMYELAKLPEHQDKKFIITYKYETWPNGFPKKSLNGYTSQQLLEMFIKDQDVPKNIVFHDSYKLPIQNILKNNGHSNNIFLSEEDGKTIELKEENIIWIIEQDERNPEFRNGFGAAKAARQFGAKPYGSGRGIVGNTYGLITKNLKAGYVEKATGIVYEKEGERSVSPEMISANIDELYECARNNPEKTFFIAYKNETRNLNGYTSKDMWNLFTDGKDVPPNIRFHESFKSLVRLDNYAKTEENYYKEKLSSKPNFERDEFTFFWHSPSPFSQWHPSLFTVKDKNSTEIVFTSAEQFMMYCKAKVFKDEAIAQEIIGLNDDPNTILNRFKQGKITKSEILGHPQCKKEWDGYQKKIKDLGRKVKNYNEEIWVLNRTRFVSRGSYEKYSQNEDLKTELLNTKDTILVEANPYDKVWAIALKESDPLAIKPERWNGLNLLGYILTNLREKLKNELKPAENPDENVRSSSRRRMK